MIAVVVEVEVYLGLKLVDRFMLEPVAAAGLRIGDDLDLPKVNGVIVNIKKWVSVGFGAVARVDLMHVTISDAESAHGV